MKIGIVGAGNIGGTLARLWSQAGHQVILSSRHPSSLMDLAQSLGKNASTATPEETARLGEIILLSIPLGQILNLSKEFIANVKGKIIMDTCNPYPERDGKAGEEALFDTSGSGIWVARHIPGAIVVKAFNSVYYRTLQSQAHRQGDPIGIPLASDDQSALATVSQLVQEAGFGPVIVGSLQRAKEFDHGSPAYASDASVQKLRKILHLH